jgi:hypothetical protein
MPRQLDLGTSEIVVRTIEVGGSKIENFSLDEILAEGSSSTRPVTMTNLTSTNLSLTDEPSSSLLFNEGGRVTGTPNITHNKTSKLTGILGKINLTGKLNIKKETGDSNVGVVIENNTSNVGVTLSDSDILSFSYVNAETKVPDTTKELPIKVHGTLETTSNLTVAEDLIVATKPTNTVKLGGNLLKIFKTPQKVEVGDTLIVDNSNTTTTVNGKLKVETINFNDSDLFVGSVGVNSSYSGGTITLDCNDCLFGRTTVSGTTSNGDTINNFIIQNQRNNSRIHGILNVTGTITLSNNTSNVINEKGSSVTASTGEKVFFVLENIDGNTYFTFKIFS